MKRNFTTLSSLIILIICASSSAISAENNDTYLNSFDGGIHNMLMMQNSALTSGIGAYEAAAGIGITTLRPTPASIYWNPAGLGFLKKGGIILEAVPQLSYSPNITQDIKKETDSALERFQKDASTIIIYPDFTLEGGQRAQAISSLALAVPYGDFNLGFAYYQNFALNVNLISAGVENLMTALESDTMQNSTIFTRTDINLLVDLNVDAYAFSCGRSITPKTAAGLTLTRLNANTTINGILAPEGIFERTGIENSFNNAAAGYQNDFYSSMIGSFKGGGWGVKAGFAYHPTANIALDFLLSFNGDLTLDGDMEIIQYFYPALNLSDDSDSSETFDLNNIDFTQPTETVLADNQPGNQLILSVPSSISLGCAYRRISLNLIKYSGELSYSFDLTRDGIPATYSRGFKPNLGFLLGFDLKYVRMSFGGIMGDEVAAGYKDDSGVPVEPSTGIIIPRFNLGTGFRINESWKVDILLLSVPDLMGSVLKAGAVYSF